MYFAVLTQAIGAPRSLAEQGHGFALEQLALLSHLCAGELLGYVASRCSHQLLLSDVVVMVMVELELGSGWIYDSGSYLGWIRKVYFRKFPLTPQQVSWLGGASRRGSELTPLPGFGKGTLHTEKWLCSEELLIYAAFRGSS